MTAAATAVGGRTALVAAVLLVVLGFVRTTWAWLGAVALVAAWWLAFPRALVQLRYRAGIRPPFVGGRTRSS